MEADTSDPLGRTEMVSIPVDLYGYLDPKGRDIPHTVYQITVEPVENDGGSKIHFMVPAVGGDKHLETKVILGGNSPGAKRSLAEAIRDAILEQLPRRSAEEETATG